MKTVSGGTDDAARPDEDAVLPPCDVAAFLRSEEPRPARPAFVDCWCCCSGDVGVVGGVTRWLWLAWVCWTLPPPCCCACADLRRWSTIGASTGGGLQEITDDALRATNAAEGFVKGGKKIRTKRGKTM